MKHLSSLVLILLILSGCTDEGSEQSGSAAGTAADYVFTNAKVYTVNPDQEWAEAVAVSGNEIVYVGDASGAAEYVGKGTETVDLGGKMLLPGFVSAHDHLIAARWMNYGVDLYGATNKAEYLEAIKQYVAAHPDEKVIRGIGWNPALYGGDPTAAELDLIVSDRPAILLEFTIHDAWLNSKALEVGEITKDTPDPLPGVTFWVRDAEGNPTGTGKEFAWLGAFIKSGAWQPESIVPASRAELQQAAIEAGITTAMTPGLVTPTLNSGMAAFDDFETVMQLLSEQDQNGELKLRTFVQPLYKNPSAGAEEFAAAAVAMTKKYDNDRLRAFGMKIHPEGNWSSKTSLMLEPYLPGEVQEKNQKPSPTTYGAAGVGAELMKEIILAANAKGIDVNIHSDGSQTIRNVVDAIEASMQAGHTDARNHLSHLFWAHPDDRQRIVNLGISLNISPNFSTDWTGQDVLARNLLGEERIATQLSVYPDIARAGNRVSLSADIPSAPLEHIGPLFQIETAMTLQDPTNPDSKPFPENRTGLTLEQAINGVTIQAAWQLRMEDKIGTLEVGKYADLVVLDEDLFSVAPRDIADVKVCATMMDGEFTHRDGI